MGDKIPIGALMEKGLQIRTGQYFRQALLITLLNPKAIVFYMAFFPLFIDPAVAPSLGTFAAMALTAAALAVTAHAQSASDPATALDEITVSATRIAQPVSDVPASVSVLRLNDLLNSVTSLRDLARGEPGVSAPAAFGATGNAPRNFPTARSFNIRGLDGNRVLIQVDGVRQPEQFTFGNAQLIGRDYFEPSLYRTAEILKGSASALYGSDAVGGVLSFISPAPTAGA